MTVKSLEVYNIMADRRELTFPLVDSDSWRVQALVRLIEPSLKDMARPIVALALADSCLEFMIESLSIKRNKR